MIIYQPCFIKKKNLTHFLACKESVLMLQISFFLRSKGMKNGAYQFSQRGKGVERQAAFLLITSRQGHINMSPILPSKSKKLETNEPIKQKCKEINREQNANKCKQNHPPLQKNTHKHKVNKNQDERTCLSTRDLNTMHTNFSNTAYS